VGLLLAILAGAGVFFLGGSIGGAGGIGGAPTTTVVIAKQPIAMRHAITASDLETSKVSGSFTSVNNTYLNTSDVVNLIAQIQISKGSVITSDMLAKDVGLVSGAAPAYLPLASGYVAMTIPTGEQQGVAGHITLGDYVTVISSANLTVFAVGSAAPSGGVKVVTKTVFTNVRVIGLGPATANVQPAGGAATVGGTTGPTGGVVSSLTIELTQCDAEFFTWFLNNTTVRYTLESFHDYLTQPPSAPDPTCPTVLSAQGVSQKEVEARYHFQAL
jgi:Flp pilus assembly protein CpaB